MADIGVIYDGEMAEIIKLRIELEEKDKRIDELENKCTLLNQACADMEETTKEYESMERRIAELEEISATAINRNQKYYREKVLAEQRIADAPHDMDCASLGLLQLYPEECTCWKSK